MPPLFQVMLISLLIVLLAALPILWPVAIYVAYRKVRLYRYLRRCEALYYEHQKAEAEYAYLQRVRKAFS